MLIRNTFNHFKFPVFPLGVKFLHVSYAAKQQDRAVNHADVNQTNSAAEVGSPTFRPVDGRLLNSGLTYSLGTDDEPDDTFSVPCNSTPTRLDGPDKARNNIGHSSTPNQLRPLTSNPDLLAAPTLGGATLLGGPVDTTNSPTSISHNLTDGTGLVQMNTALTSVSHLDLGALKATLRCLGPQLLRGMDANASAKLICFLGACSDKKDTNRIYDSSAEHGHENFAINFWEEIVMLAEMKEAMGQTLRHKEKFWSSRAYLERARLTNLPADREIASLFYSRLPTRTKSKLSVIIPYLKAFLVHPSNREFGDALDTLCGILRKQRNPHRDVVEILWRLILVNDSVLSQEHKSKVLSMFIHRFVVFNSGHSKDSGIPLRSIGDLATGFGASFFPSYHKPGLPGGIFSWLNSSARKAIVDAASADSRFSNLTLLAMWFLPRNLYGSREFYFISSDNEWRVITGLSILDRSLSSCPGTSAEQRQMNNVARTLWSLWKGAPTLDIPKEVSRVVAIAFLHTAVRLRDGTLLDACLDHVSSDRLWAVSGVEEPEARQVEQLFGALADCVPVFKRQVWAKLLSLLWDVSLNNPYYLNLYLRNVFQQLACHDAQVAWRFYCESLLHKIPVPPEALFPVARNLAHEHKWDQVITFLQSGQFRNTMLEQLLETILCIFQSSRQEIATPRLVAAVGEGLSTCFSTTSLPDRLKYPIRFFLPLMITSHHPLKAVQLLKVLLLNNRIMFSSRYFLRIIRTLLHHRHPTLAIEVLRLARETFKGKNVVVSDLIKKTKQGLARAGVVEFMRHRDMSPQLTLRNLRDRLVSLSARRPTQSVAHAVLRMFPVLTASPVDGSAILIAVQILVKNRCLSMARQLIKRSHHQLKSQNLTAIGNVYLHGPLLFWEARNERIMRHVLRTKDLLAQKYGFVPDRVTVNIVIKTMLRWRKYVDSRMVLSLFDQLIRCGYPVSEQWLTANGVPFSTPLRKTALDLSGIRQGLSFKRHVRPLYKMFIKELFLRQNARAAHRVIGILKEEEALAAEKKEHRERVRRLGVAKKQRKRALARNNRSKIDE